MFDDNIENLKEIKNDIFVLDYKSKKLELSAKELFYMLSSGTTKGISLYTYAIQSLFEGNAFNKTPYRKQLGIFTKWFYFISKANYLYPSCLP